MAPYRQTNPLLWKLSHGPALRLVKSERKEIKSVVFKVDSLKAAVRTLEDQGFLGPRGKNTVQVKAPEHWEFSIILQE